jgi:hypothetical protein
MLFLCLPSTREVYKTTSSPGLRSWLSSFLATQNMQARPSHNAILAVVRVVNWSGCMGAYGCIDLHCQYLALLVRYFTDLLESYSTSGLTSISRSILHHSSCCPLERMLADFEKALLVEATACRRSRRPSLLSLHLSPFVFCPPHAAIFNVVAFHWYLHRLDGIVAAVLPQHCFLTRDACLTPFRRRRISPVDGRQPPTGECPCPSPEEADH